MPASQPVTVRGKTFSSINECARFFDVRSTTVRRHMARGTLDRLGTSERVYDGLPHKITIRGQTFPTQRAAAEFFGVDESAISVAKQRGRLDYVGTKNVLS